MQAKSFLLSLLALTFCIHLFRFPHLILQNGGGAFLILFFLMLNALAFPLLIAEKVLDEKLKNIDLRSLISVKKSNSLKVHDRLFIAAWFGLRIVVLVLFLWFFLFIGSSCMIYFFFFVGSSFDWSTPVTDIPNLPNMHLSLLTPGLWVGGAYFVFYRYFKSFYKVFNRLILPALFCVLFFLFLKIILLLNDFEGLKTLLYPDFLAITTDSLLAAVGQSLACLFIGLGFYNKFNDVDKSIDSIELFVRAIMMALIVAIIVGVMALPMIEQVSELPFGSNWIFQILPRWLSYGFYGNYYCGVFFLSLGLLSFFVSVVLHVLISDNTRKMIRLSRGSKSLIFLNVSFVALNAAMILILQNQLHGWSGQSLLLNVDGFVVHWALPFLALMMIWVLNRYTKQSERLAVFEKQQIFFHSRFFYSIWEKFVFFLVPGLIVAGWVLSLFL